MLQKKVERLTNWLKKEPLPLNSLDRFDISDLEFELILANGYPIFIENNKIYLKTAINKVYEQTFCLVDIEATNSNIKKGQIIEIAAIKIKNKKIIEHFHSFAYAKKIPKVITKLTNITKNDLINAPKIEDVLLEFKLFLEDDVFVAHGVEFDYDFISKSLKKYHLGELFNRRLCSFKLASQTIDAPKHGLKTLKEVLNISNAHHRALDDTISLAHIFIKSLTSIDDNITTEELILNF